MEGPMPRLISIISALALLLTGAWLLHDGVLARDPLHLQIEIIAGATLLSAVVCVLRAPPKRLDKVEARAWEI